ncbi:hypothetical protein Dimus_036850 [Dionaea muscipula]
MTMIPTTKGMRRLSWPWARGGGGGVDGSTPYDNHHNPDEWLLAGEVSDGRWQERSLADVPKGYLPVYVGPELRRFVIPMEYLSMPDFRILMERAEEEFGFDQEGGLKIPCEEQDVVEVLFKCLARQKMMSKTKRNK